MEKLLTTLIIVVLNFGLYAVFCFKTSKTAKKVFSIVFLVTILFFEIVEGQYLDLIRISYLLLGLYLMGYVILKFIIYKFLERNNIGFYGVIRKIIIFFILPLYTLMVTAFQVLSLQDAL